MSFYNPSDSKFARHYREEVEMVFSAVDCILHRDHVIYCSSELTTGLRLYKALREHGLKTASELRKKMGDRWFNANLWDVNTEAAIRFAENVRSVFQDRTIVITPAPFSAPGWSQAEYLAFWEALLRTRIKSVWFNDNWWLSNGCTFEFAVAQDAGLPTVDREGNVLHRNEGIKLVQRAIEELEAEGFDTAKLRENLAHMSRARSQGLPAPQPEMSTT